MTQQSDQELPTVAIVQPALPKYRVPVFELLSKRADGRLRVIHGTVEALPNARSDGLSVSEFRRKELSVIGRRLTWSASELRLVAQAKADVVILEWNLSNVLLVVELAALRARGRAILLWGHAYSLDDGPVRAWLRRSIGRLADGVIVYDSQTADSLVSAGLRPERVHVAVNTLDNSTIKIERSAWLRDRGRLAEFQQTHGLSGRPVILHLSRLGPHRRLDVLIDALPAILRHHPDCLVVIIGDGLSEAKRLRDRAASQGIEDSVRFIDGSYEESELAPWFLSSALFCSPGHLGLSVFHAFSYGLPVVTSNAFAHHPPEARAVVDGETGALFESGDSNALARTVITLLNDTDGLAEMGRRAEAVMEEAYGIESMVDSISNAVLQAHSRHAG